MSSGLRWQRRSTRVRELRRSRGHLWMSDISSKTQSSKNKLNVSVYVYQAGGAKINTRRRRSTRSCRRPKVFPTLVGTDQGVPYSVLVHDYSELRLPR